MQPKNPDILRQLISIIDEHLIKTELFKPDDIKVKINCTQAKGNQISTETLNFDQFQDDYRSGEYDNNRLFLTMGNCLEINLGYQPIHSQPGHQIHQWPLDSIYDHEDFIINNDNTERGFHTVFLEATDLHAKRNLTIIFPEEMYYPCANHEFNLEAYRLNHKPSRIYLLGRIIAEDAKSIFFVYEASSEADSVLIFNHATGKGVKSLLQPRADQLYHGIIDDDANYRNINRDIIGLADTIEIVRIESLDTTSGDDFQERYFENLARYQIHPQYFVMNRALQEYLDEHCCKQPLYCALSKCRAKITRVLNNTKLQFSLSDKELTLNLYHKKSPIYGQIPFVRRVQVCLPNDYHFLRQTNGNFLDLFTDYQCPEVCSLLEIKRTEPVSVIPGNFYAEWQNELGYFVLNERHISSLLLITECKLPNKLKNLQSCNIMTLVEENFPSLGINDVLYATILPSGKAKSENSTAHLALIYACRWYQEEITAAYTQFLARFGAKPLHYESDGKVSDYRLITR